MGRGFAVVIAMMVLLSTGCGGGGGGGGGSGATAPPPPPEETPLETNVATIKVGRGPFGVANLPLVSVTVCAPGDASRCYAIDNIIVDTGSAGLRLTASALASAAPNLALPAVQGSGGSQLFECIGFIDGSYAWGGLRSADVKIGGLTAAGVPIQVIGDAPPSAAKPSRCDAADATLDISVAANLGANGILGVHHRVQDCGVACTSLAYFSAYDDYWYFTCTPTTCTPAAAPLVAQTRNPVASFPSDNNGIVMQLPGLSATGSSGVSGSLVFGIGTRANNAPGNAHLFNSRQLTTEYKGVEIAAFVDSGSNGLFFDDAGIPLCSTSTFFCPAQPLSLSGTIGDDTSVTRLINFSVVSAQALSGYAFNNLAGSFSATETGSGPSYFDWGLPFFFGRSVYFGLENSNYSNRMGF